MRTRIGGFSLVELAVVMSIVAFMLGGLMYTLSAQTEQRNFEETRRRLEQARELVLAFAVVNGRLPCPATATSNGDEAPAGGGPCTGYLPNNASTPQTGFLPALAIGYRQVDSLGFAIDPWGNRLRYGVSTSATAPTGSTGCTAPLNPDAFTTTAKLKSNGIACVPLNIVICSASQNTNSGVSPPSCGTFGVTGDARPVTNQRTVVAVIFAPGKNTVVGSGGADETENVDNDGVFVWHDPRPLGAQGGEFDDQLTWISVGELYGKMIAAGTLP